MKNLFNSTKILFIGDNVNYPYMGWNNLGSLYRNGLSDEDIALMSAQGFVSDLDTIKLYVVDKFLTKNERDQIKSQKLNVREIRDLLLSKPTRLKV